MPKIAVCGLDLSLDSKRIVNIVVVTTKSPQTTATMEIGFSHLHSALRWILLILLVLSVSKVMMGGGKRFFEKDRKLALVVLILAHLQLLIGFALYFMKNYSSYLSNLGDQPAYVRFFAIEHMAGMVIAIILITLGYGKVKRGESDAAKMRAVKVFYGLALIIILVSIPWPFREGFAHLGWF